MLYSIEVFFTKYSSETVKKLVNFASIRYFKTDFFLICDVKKYVKSVLVWHFNLFYQNFSESMKKYCPVLTSSLILHRNDISKRMLSFEMKNVKVDLPKLLIYPLRNFLKSTKFS